MQQQAGRSPLGLTLCALLLVLVSASRRGAGARGEHDSRGGTLATHSFVRSLAFKQRLRICNAYPYASPLDVFIGQARLTTEPLPYKVCGEFLPELRVDDKIDFKVDGTSAGTFTISELPNNDAVLLMVIYRHSTGSTAVAFESHVFAGLNSPQIAVLDTYKGEAKAELRIQDKTQSQINLRSEVLRFDNVVAVDPGVYEVLLLNETSNSTKAKAELVAVPHEAYVVIRCGVEAQLGQRYPEELMVYPMSDRRNLGGSAGMRISGLTFLAMLLGLLVQ